MTALPGMRAGLRAVRGERESVVHGSVIGIALVLWLAAARAVDLDAVGGLGLVQALSAGWFVALGLLLAGFAVAVHASMPNPLTLWLYLGALILVLHATTAVAYDVPRSVFVYKHLALIDLIETTGGVDRTLDIYNNWPGFFALDAWLSAAGGIDPAVYANWAPVAFNALFVLVVRFALRGLVRDERLLWVASLVFLLGNWIGQDYLAPQALGFTLALVVLGLCLRWQRPGERPMRPRATVAVGALCFGATVVSHQLTPVMLILTVAALSLLTRRVPRWVPVAMAAVEAAWIALAWTFLNASGPLFSFDVLTNARPPIPLGSPDPGVTVTAWAARGVVVLLVVLAGLALLKRRRAGLPNRELLVLIGAPAAVVLVANYGGEGGLRAYLFALPWLSLLVAALLLGVRAPLPAGAGRRVPPPPRRPVRVVALGLLAFVLAAGSVQAAFGAELVNEMRPDDVAAARWFERHAPAGSALVTVTGNLPDPLTARYAVLARETKAFANILTEDQAFMGKRLDAARLPEIERWIAGLPASRRFVALTGSQARELRLRGMAPGDSVESLGDAMGRSPHFELRFFQGDAVVFEWRP